MAELVLIYPPVALPSEPPLGMATVAGFLKRAGVPFHVMDLNVETFERLLSADCPGPEPVDRFSRRALAKLGKSLEQVRSSCILSEPQRYRSAISHIQRALYLRTEGTGAPRFTLRDFIHPCLSPLCSAELRRMALERSMGHVGRWMEQRVIQSVMSVGARCVGFSLQYLSQALPAMALCGAIKEAAPNVRVVMGGALVTSWERIGRLPDLRPWVDQLIPGHDLSPLAMILGLDPESLKGDPPLPELQGFPWRAYLSPRRMAPMFTSLGCYWGRCKFCPEAGRAESFRSIPAREVPRRMEQIMRETGAHYIHVTDNAIPPKTLEALAGSRLEIPWFGFARFEPMLSRAGVARGLRGSGCRMLQLGLESGSQRVLERLGKGIKLEVVSRILSSLHQEGIATYVYVLLGTPGETLEDARKTMEFVADNAASIDYLHCSIMNLPRAVTAPRDVQIMEFPGKQSQDLSLYVDFRACEGMDRKTARRFLEREFSREPTIAQILRKDPPAFTSAHAALFSGARDGKLGQTG